MSLIGITGLAQHGKTSIANRLAEAHGFSVFNFADALKSMALVLNPYVLVEESGDDYYLRLSRLVELSSWEAAKESSDVRRFLQVLGTEAVRDHLGENSWVDALDLAIEKAGDPVNVVIGDVRFPNEARYIHDNAGFLMRVTRIDPYGFVFDNGISKDHPSEAHIESLPVDFDITAPSGRLDILNSAVDSVLKDIKERGI